MCLSVKVLSATCQPGPTPSRSRRITPRIVPTRTCRERSDDRYMVGPPCESAIAIAVPPCARLDAGARIALLRLDIAPRRQTCQAVPLLYDAQVGPTMPVLDRRGLLRWTRAMRLRNDLSPS